MNAMSLLTRGYICPLSLPDGVVIGSGPAIVDADELKPVIDRGREIVAPGPTILGASSEDD